MSHANAPLTPSGRLRLARCIVEDRWPLRRAADRFGVSITTAQRWAQRYREHGKDGMLDRSSRPHVCPTQLDRRTERRILGLRVSRRWGPERIAYRLRLNPSTVHKVLRRYQAPPEVSTELCKRRGGRELTEGVSECDVYVEEREGGGCCGGRGVGGG